MDTSEKIAACNGVDKCCKCGSFLSKAVGVKICKKCGCDLNESIDELVESEDAESVGDNEGVSVAGFPGVFVLASIVVAYFFSF